MTESFTKTDNKQKCSSFRNILEKESLGSRFCNQRNEGMIKTKVNEDIINVFVPTPNPTSGFLLMVPKKILFILMFLLNKLQNL